MLPGQGVRLRFIRPRSSTGRGLIRDYRSAGETKPPRTTWLAKPCWNTLAAQITSQRAPHRVPLFAWFRDQRIMNTPPAAYVHIAAQNAAQNPAQPKRRPWRRSPQTPTCPPSAFLNGVATLRSRRMYSLRHKMRHNSRHSENAAKAPRQPPVTDRALLLIKRLNLQKPKGFSPAPDTPKHAGCHAPPLINSK